MYQTWRFYPRNKNILRQDDNISRIPKQMHRYLEIIDCRQRQLWSLRIRFLPPQRLYTSSTIPPTPVVTGVTLSPTSPPPLPPHPCGAPSPPPALPPQPGGAPQPPPPPPLFLMDPRHHHRYRHHRQQGRLMCASGTRVCSSSAGRHFTTAYIYYQTAL